MFFPYIGFDNVCTMALTLYLMQNYQDIDINAPFYSAFKIVVGWKWAHCVVALGALKSMASVLLVVWGKFGTLHT